MIVRVTNIDRAVWADGYAVWTGKAGGCRRPAVTIAALSPAGDGGNSSRGHVDAANGIVLGIDHQNVAVAIERELLRRIEYRLKCRAAVA